MVRTAPSQERNTEEKRSTDEDDPEMIDDLDLDLEDLDLDDDNTIPSEETDPDWMH